MTTLLSSDAERRTAGDLRVAAGYVMRSFYTQGRITVYQRGVTGGWRDEAARIPRRSEL